MITKEMMIMEFKEYIRTNTESVMDIPFLTAKAAIWVQLVAKREKYAEPDLCYGCGNHVSKTEEHYAKVIRRKYSKEELWRLVRYSFSDENNKEAEHLVLSVILGCPNIPVRSKATLSRLFEE